MDQGFGIPFGAKAMAPTDQILPQALKIVDLPVVGNPYSLILIAEGLTAAFHVNDTQADVTEHHVVVLKETLSIRPAMTHHVHHMLDDPPIALIHGEIDCTGYPTHVGYRYVSRKHLMTKGICALQARFPGSGYPHRPPIAGKVGVTTLLKP